MNELFRVHKLNDGGLLKAAYIAECFDALLTELAGVCTQGREFAIVKTKLEEAAFFAKKAMASNQENQQSEGLI